MINALETWIDNAWWQWGNSIHFRIDRYEDNIDRCAFFYEINRGWYDMYDPDDDWEAFKCYEKQSGLLFAFTP